MVASHSHERSLGAAADPNHPTSAAFDEVPATLDLVWTGALQARVVGPVGTGGSSRALR